MSGPYAEVQQLGRWTWVIRVVHGIIADQYPTIVRGSSQRADRIARRRLARYVANEERQSRSHRVAPPTTAEQPCGCRLTHVHDYGCTKFARALGLQGQQ